MVFKRVMLLLLFSAAVAGCSMPVKPRMHDTSELAPGMGIMIARIAMPYLLRSNHLATSVQVVSLNSISGSGQFVALDSAETFIVMPLSAGTYELRSLNIGGYYSRLSSMEFDISAGKINYVGDLTMVMQVAAASNAEHPDHSYYRKGPAYHGGLSYVVNTRIYDYHQRFLPDLALQYPILWKNYPVAVSLIHRADLKN